MPIPSRCWCHMQDSHKDSMFWCQNPAAWNITCSIIPGGSATLSLCHDQRNRPGSITRVILIISTELSSWSRLNSFLLLFYCNAHRMSMSVTLVYWSLVLLIESGILGCPNWTVKLPALHTAHVLAVRSKTWVEHNYLCSPVWPIYWSVSASVGFVLPLL